MRRRDLFLRAASFLLAAALLIPALGFTAGSAEAEPTSSVWLQYRNGPGHTGHNPNETKLGRGNVVRLTEQWENEISGGSAFHSNPTVKNGLVYAAEYIYLYALNSETGDVRWKVDIGFSGPSPVIAGTSLYLGVPAYDDRLSAFSAASGKLRWTAETGRIDSPVAVDNGLVYATSLASGQVYAVDATTGALAWSTTDINSANIAPAVVNGIVYVATESSVGSRLVALDASTGERLWSSNPVEDDISTPAVANGMVYVQYFHGQVAAFDAATGARQWSVNATPDGGYNVGELAVADGVVYVGSQIFGEAAYTSRGRLSTFDAATGGGGWSTDVDNPILSPVVGNGLVYVGSAGGFVYAFDAPTGEELWRSNQYGTVEASVTLADGVLYFGSTDNKLRALAIPEGSNPGPDPEEPQSDFKVMTWNIKGAAKPDLKNGVAPEILHRDADIVGLQEIQEHQAERLQEYLSDAGEPWEMRWNRTGNTNCCPPRKEGHAILSRLGIRGDQKTGRKWALSSGRILQRVVVDLDGGILLYNTHLCNDCDAESARQARKVIRNVSEDGESQGGSSPAILVGDFNNGPTSTTVKQITGNSSSGQDGWFSDAWGVLYPSSLDRSRCPRGASLSECGWTSTTSSPRSRIDYVFVGSGLSVDSITTPFAETDASFDSYEKLSDHFPVLATLSFSP